MIGVSDVQEGKNRVGACLSKIREMKDAKLMEAQRELRKIAYVDEDNVDELQHIVDMYVNAISKLPPDEDESGPAFCLVQINFAKINEMANQSSIEYMNTNYGKQKKWTERECLEFFDTTIIPALVERFRIVDHWLYFRELWGYWRKVGCDADIRKIVNLAILMVEPLNIPLTNRMAKNVTEVVVGGIQMTTLEGDAEIQFTDCLVTSSGQLTRNMPKRFPRYIFNFNAWDILTSTEPVPEVDDLLLHLANGDEDVKQCLIERLSMTFVASISKKAALGPKAVVLYGPTGRNGKSTLANLLIRALREENCERFSLSAFKDYELAKVRDNLLLVDSDASSVHVSPEISTAMKIAVTADAMVTRQIYKEAMTTTPLVQFLICTNSMPKAEDKTAGWDRRLEWYEVKERLVRDRAWFDVIESREAANYMLRLLVTTAVRLVANGKPIRIPEAVSETNASYSELNKNVRAWLECEAETRKVNDISEVLVRVPSAKAHADYVAWCEENAENPFGLNNFNSIVATETGLRRKLIAVSAERDPEAFAWWQEHTSSDTKFTVNEARVKCWVKE